MHSEWVGGYGSYGTPHQRGREEANGGTDQRVVPLAEHPVWLQMGRTAEKCKCIWQWIRDEEAGQLPKHVWKVVVEHSMAESMLAFDKRSERQGPRPCRRKTVSKCGIHH